MDWMQNGIRFFIDNKPLVDVPYNGINKFPKWKSFLEWGKPWKSITNQSDPNNNPWFVSNDPELAPFDTKFHFILNVAVGGNNGFITDSAINRGGNPKHCKPWTNNMNQSEAMTHFYNQGEGWKQDWQEQSQLGDNDGLQVDYIRVYKRRDLHPETQNDCPSTES